VGYLFKKYLCSKPVKKHTNVDDSGVKQMSNGSVLIVITITTTSYGLMTVFYTMQHLTDFFWGKNGHNVSERSFPLEVLVEIPFSLPVPHIQIIPKTAPFLMQMSHLDAGSLGRVSVLVG